MNKPNQEVIDFNVTEVAIFELHQEYMPLKINGLDDKEGAKAVSAARKIVKGYRIDVDKRRKELNADALEWQRKINSEAKRITNLLEPIEAHLEAQEKWVADELDRIKRAKEKEEADRLQVRVLKLTSIKFMFDGINYYSTYPDTFTQQRITVAVLHLKQMTDDEFNEIFDNAKHYFDIASKEHEEKEKLRQKQLLQDEADRKALAEERARLDAIAKEQTAKEAALKQEAERIESLKRYKESKFAVIECHEAHKGEPCFVPDLGEVETAKIPVLQFKTKFLDKYINSYQPHTAQELEAWSEGVEFSFWIVMAVLDVDKANSLDEVFKESVDAIRASIEAEFKLLKHI